MLINQKRVRSIKRHLPAEFHGKILRFGHGDVTAFRERLFRIGFTEALEVGESVLPAIIGPLTRFNAEGKQVVRRDLDKETAYRQIEWHWTEYHGDQEVQRSDFRDVPYTRYPRDRIPPPSIELQMLVGLDGAPVIVTAPIAYTDANEDAIRNSINLCLEVFQRECQVFTAELEPVIEAPVKRLNWRVLPPGRHPWDQLAQVLDPVIERAKRGNRGVIRRRLKVINEAQPEFVAVGNGGFTGYLVFGFPAKGLFVLESAYYGNATYVFGDDWETLSQYSKAQILNNDLHLQRIVHREGWIDEIQRLLL